MFMQVAKPLVRQERKEPAVAAKRAGRKYCCIEIDKEYYDVMRRRLESMIY